MIKKQSTRPRWEVADIVRKFFPTFQMGRNLSAADYKVANHIRDCRTAALGGHLEKCNNSDCGKERPAYNSCRDRHCPKCQTMAKEKWLEARKADLLPVSYFHNVFTLPHSLNALIRYNKNELLNLLFKSVSSTLKEFGLEPKGRLGGKLGFTLVLHTWSQRLLEHFHLHCVIPAGVLKADNTWKLSENDSYLFNVKALSGSFREKYLDMLMKLHSDGKLVFSEDEADLKDPIAFRNFCETLKDKNWVVFSKAPFGGPEEVLRYLGRYTHRVAISNNRIVDVSDQRVSFTVRDNENPKTPKIENVTGEEFLRRFLLHTLPSGFMRIRHYGFLASRNKKKELDLCRLSLNAPTPITLATKISGQERMLELTGIDILLCPNCKKGRMYTVKEIQPIRSWMDSS